MEVRINILTFLGVFMILLQSVQQARSLQCAVAQKQKEIDWSIRFSQSVYLFTLLPSN